MTRTMMDWVNTVIKIEERKANGDTLTYEEWCRIRRTGSPEEIAEAVERMNAAGGYDNLVAVDQIRKGWAK